MSSDKNDKSIAEWIKPDESYGVRLFAYSAALSGKDRGALASSETKAKGGTGITGLRDELEKTKLDV